MTKTTGKTKAKTDTRKRVPKPIAMEIAADLQSAMSPAAVSREAIADLAYQLFLQRGGQHGYDVDDWVTAEKQLAAQ